MIVNEKEFSNLAVMMAESIVPISSRQLVVELIAEVDYKPLLVRVFTFQGNYQLWVNASHPLQIPKGNACFGEWVYLLDTDTMKAQDFNLTNILGSFKKDIYFKGLKVMKSFPSSDVASYLDEDLPKIAGSYTIKSKRIFGLLFKIFIKNIVLSMLPRKKIKLAE